MTCCCYCLPVYVNPSTSLVLDCHLPAANTFNAAAHQELSCGDPFGSLIPITWTWENNERKKGNYHNRWLPLVRTGWGRNHPEHLSGGFLRPRWHRCRMPRFHGCLPPLPVIHALIRTDIPGWMLPMSVDWCRLGMQGTAGPDGSGLFNKNMRGSQCSETKGRHRLYL